MEKMEEKNRKIERVRKYLERNGFSGMVLVRQDNFNWITSGGSNRVIIPDAEGVAAVVITLYKIYLTAKVMDGQRILDEEMQSLHAEYVPLHWYEESVLKKAVELAGDHPVMDVRYAGTAIALEDIYDLHFPLSESEIGKLEELGGISDEILTRVAKEVRPGMIDYEVEAMFLYEYAKRGILCDVLLIGTDERIFHYKHPTTVGRKLGNYVLLHPAVRMQGLHCNVSRSIYFGDRLPEEISRAYEAVSNVEFYCMSRSIKDECWADILKGHKKLLREFGFEEDWRDHYPGGRTGYFVCQSDLSLKPEKRLCNNEAYDWFITVKGAKVEELTVNHNGILKCVSNTGVWPQKTVEYEGVKGNVPQIMML